MSALADLRITKPAANDKSAENQHRYGDEQTISQRARIRVNRRLSSGHGTRRLWHNDGLFANRTINLHSGIIDVALDVLAALRTGEFEFSHKFLLAFGIGNADIKLLFLKKCKRDNPAAVISNSPDSAASNLSAEKFRPCG
jgi:hypothetical protein